MQDFKIMDKPSFITGWILPEWTCICGYELYSNTNV